MAQFRRLAAALSVNLEDRNTIPARMPERLARINGVHGNMGKVDAFLIKETADLTNIRARGVTVEFNV